MHKVLMIGIVVIGCFGISWSAVEAGDQSLVSYPDNYRSWQHLKTMVILPGHSLENPFHGIHHIYGNKLAIQGQQTGNYETGATLVFDLLEYQEGGNAMVEGSRKLVGVMQRDTKAYASTGGWGFEGFAGDSKTKRLVSDGGSSCYGCHTAVASSSYVFAKYRP